MSKIKKALLSHARHHRNLVHVLSYWSCIPMRYIHGLVNANGKLLDVLWERLRSIIRYIQIWKHSMNMHTSLLTCNENLLWTKLNKVLIYINTICILFVKVYENLIERILPEYRSHFKQFKKFILKWKYKIKLVRFIKQL